MGWPIRLEHIKIDKRVLTPVRKTKADFLTTRLFGWLVPQAMGTTALNMHERMDGLLYALVHPQKPMVTTRVLDLVHFDEACLFFIALFIYWCNSCFDMCR